MTLTDVLIQRPLRFTIFLDLKAWFARRARRKAYRELLTYDDRLLRDMGIARAELWRLIERD